MNKAEIGKEKELTVRFRNTYQLKITDENGGEMETEISAIITQEQLIQNDKQDND